MRPSRPGLFVTGTDTGVGKTIVSAALLSGAPEDIAGVGPLNYWKPVQTGDDDDAGTVERLSEGRYGRVVAPTAHFQLPASPHHAAEVEGAEIQLPTLHQAWVGLPGKAYLAEGAGGWMVPLNRQALWSDFVSPLGLPVLIVASTRLGCINHTLMSIAAVQRTSPVIGLVMVGPHDPSAWSGIQAHTKVPILDHLDHAATIDTAQVRLWGQQLWSGPAGEAVVAALAGFGESSESSPPTASAS